MNENPNPSEIPTNKVITTVVICLGLFLFAYTVPLASPVQKQIAKSLGLEKPSNTWPVFTSYPLAWLFIIPPGAFLADRFGRKTMLLAGSVTLAIGMLLFSFSTNLTMACIAQFLNGAGAILLQIVGVAIITDLSSEARGSALSLIVGVVGMVALLSPMFMNELVEGNVLSWEMVYRYSAILPIIAFVAQLFCWIPQPTSGVGISGKDVGELLTSPLFLLLIVSMLLYGIVEGGIPTWAPAYLNDELEAPERWKGFVGTAYWLIMSLVRAIVGGFRLFEKVPYPKMIAANAALGAICLALGTLPNNKFMAVVFLPLTGAVIAMIWPSLMTYAVQTTGKPTATVFGLVVGLGGATGVLLGGALGRLNEAGLSFQHSLLALELPLCVLILFFGILIFSQGKPSAGQEPSMADKSGD